MPVVPGDGLEISPSHLQGRYGIGGAPTYRVRKRGVADKFDAADARFAPIDAYPARRPGVLLAATASSHSMPRSPPSPDVGGVSLTG